MIFRIPKNVTSDIPGKDFLEFGINNFSDKTFFCKINTIFMTGVYV